MDAFDKFHLLKLHSSNNCSIDRIALGQQKEIIELLFVIKFVWCYLCALFKRCFVPFMFYRPSA